MKKWYTMLYDQCSLIEIEDRLKECKSILWETEEGGHYDATDEIEHLLSMIDDLNSGLFVYEGYREMIKNFTLQQKLNRDKSPSPYQCGLYDGLRFAVSILNGYIPEENKSIIDILLEQQAT